MRKEYDFTHGKKSVTQALKKPVTIRLGTEVILYFKGPSAQTGIPYQNLVKLYLRDCALTKRMIFIGDR